MRKVLANTTPLIALANINQLELLHKLYGTVIVPQAVIDEIVREPAKHRVHECSWIKVEKIEPAMNELICDGLYISETVKRYVLNQAGE